MAKPTGRPTIYNDELAERIALHVSYGASLEIAAKAEGIGCRTVYDWMGQGRTDGRHAQPGFAQLIEKARAGCIATNLGRLNRVAEQGDTKAITWLLARLAPDLYAEPPKRMTVEGRAGNQASLVLEVRHVARGDDSDDGNSDGDGNSVSDGSAHDQG